MTPSLPRLHSRRRRSQTGPQFRSDPAIPKIGARWRLEAALQKGSVVSR